MAQNGAPNDAQRARRTGRNAAYALPSGGRVRDQLLDLMLPEIGVFPDHPVDQLLRRTYLGARLHTRDEQLLVVDVDWILAGREVRLIQDLLAIDVGVIG